MSATVLHDKSQLLLFGGCQYVRAISTTQTRNRAHCKHNSPIRSMVLFIKKKNRIRIFQFVVFVWKKMTSIVLICCFKKNQFGCFNVGTPPRRPSARTPCMFSTPPATAHGHGAPLSPTAPSCLTTGYSQTYSRTHALTHASQNNLPKYSTHSLKQSINQSLN